MINPAKPDLDLWLAGRVRVLDGAMGSELLRRGIGAAAKLWGVGALLEAPDAVRQVHRDNAAAGAEALTTNTYRVAPYSLGKVGLADLAQSLANQGTQLAREGAALAGRDVIVLACQTTLEDCYRPDLVPESDILYREHLATARVLAASGPDGLLLETFNCIREARIATEAAIMTGLPVFVCFTCVTDGRLLSGEPARDAATAVSLPGVCAVGVNCTKVSDTLSVLQAMKRGTTLPLVAYANNAWHAEDSRWLAATPITPEQYAVEALEWAGVGARLVGGCCGTEPAHIASLASALAVPPPTQG